MLNRIYPRLMYIEECLAEEAENKEDGVITRYYYSVKVACPKERKRCIRHSLYAALCICTSALSACGCWALWIFYFSLTTTTTKAERDPIGGMWLLSFVSAILFLVVAALYIVGVIQTRMSLGYWNKTHEFNSEVEARTFVESMRAPAKIFYK